jgi:Tfp pilus assembly protein PilN
MNDSQTKPAIVQSIDFLPTSYHRTKQQHQKTVWRRALLVVFLALIVTGTLRQFYVQSALKQDRDRIAKQANGMLSQLEDPQGIQKRIEFLTTQADLRAELQLQAAPTRVLHAVTSSLPPFVTVTEYHATYETLQERVNRRNAIPPASPVPSGDEQEAAYPEQTDLKELRTQRNTTVLTVSLKGIAPNELAVSKYLAALEQTGLFEEVKPIVSEPFTYRTHLLRSFTFRLQVARPGRHLGKPTSETNDSPSPVSGGRIAMRERIAR